MSACNNNEPNDDNADSNGPHLFTSLSPDSTHIDFNNPLTEGLNTNVLLYEYFYNGGGVAVGDLNNDGLQDIYFSSNLGDNKLYLNQSGMQFQDITVASNVQSRPGPWKTGVTIADVNGDGKEDIYVCYSGKMPSFKRANQLFINQGNDKAGIPNFLEQATEFGIADTGYATQSFFFDFDRDGDLDMFLMNHNPTNLPLLDEASTLALLAKREFNTGVKLFRNDNNHFVDITSNSGLSSSALSYGLGAGIADINLDGWPDIYVSNDYGVPDYLYINNKKGGFTDQLNASLGHISLFSMGNSVADINNDALPDIFTLDMLPEDNLRQKLLFAPDNYEKFDLGLRRGFHHQYMRNMLQLNNGDGTFSEIGQLSGISNTDWSWSPLFADLDNDGWKDLYVSNGYLRDFTNMDFLKYKYDFIQKKGRLQREEVLDIIKKMSSSNVVNYTFQNNQDLTFKNVGKKWGLTTPSSSNGAAYVDLDNDGDLDLVVNNINQPAFIYRNNAEKENQNHFLQIKLAGAKKNTDGYGAMVTIYQKNNKQYLEQMPARGFQSTVSPILHFGLGKETIIDSLRIVWLGGKEQMLTNIKSDQLLTLKETEATHQYKAPNAKLSIFKEVSSPIKYVSAENLINDFKRQTLLVNPLSFSGPSLVKGDVNGDGLEDVFAGGGSGKPGSLYIQEKNGQFSQKSPSVFEADALGEDADALFVDVNNDGFNDLYVVSGGYHNYQVGDVLFQDRLYLNDGKGNFSKAPNSLPAMKGSKSCVRAADVNGDGFMDLFVGGRNVPGRYPESPQSYLLINDGKGNFSDKIESIAPQLKNVGMVTDAVWYDINHDKKMDLILVGEWMPIMAMVNVNGKLENKTTSYFDKEYSGWWNKLLLTDLNGDGFQDLVIGNMGLNSQAKASDKEPADMYYKDFDNNGSVDPILCFYIQHKTYPYVTRDELLEQMSIMRTRFTDYQSYSNTTLDEVFTSDELKNAKHLQANDLTTSYFEGSADGKFNKKDLPLQAQFSPVFTINALDYNNDGNMDLILCGNMNQARIRFGKYDANFGMLLKGDGKGHFNYVTQQESGFHIRGDVRTVLSIKNNLLFGINQQPIKVYQPR
jgi:hypothetical protein